MATLCHFMPEFDLAAVGFMVYPPGTGYGPYVTETDEMVWIAEGVATLETAGETHRLPANSVVLSPAGVTNEYAWDPSHVTRHGIVSFTVEGCSPPVTSIRRLDSGDVVLALLEHIRWLERERPPAWEDLLREALAYAVRVYRSDASRSLGPNGADLSPTIELSLLAIRDRWSPDRAWTPIALDDLAAAAAVTPEHLCRVYTAELGCAPVTALRLVRLRRSVDLLTRSNMLVGEIAHQVGFRNQFHFSRSFKRAFGVPPTALRRRPKPEIRIPDATRRLWPYVWGG